MQKTSVFPGSFDPITIGHADIIKRALPLFEKIIIAIGDNSEKQYLFPIKKRLDWIKDIYNNENKIEVISYDGLTIDFCNKAHAQYILRGLRSASDFEFEKKIAQLNHSMNKKIETICIISSPELSHISSTIVREIYVNGGDISQFVPKDINIKS